MIYEYFCEHCSLSFDIVKEVKYYNKDEFCVSCTRPMVKIFSKTQLMGLNDQAEYNPGLGQLIKNKTHLKEVLKERNLIEVGNESPDKIQKNFNKLKSDKYKQSWESV